MSQTFPVRGSRNAGFPSHLPGHFMSVMLHKEDLIGKVVKHHSHRLCVKRLRNITAQAVQNL